MSDWLLRPTWIRHHRIPEISNKGAAEEFAYKGYAEHSTEITTENAKRGSSQGPRGPFDIVESEIQDIYYTCIRAKEKEKRRILERVSTS